jgi:hypothetical protein
MAGVAGRPAMAASVEDKTSGAAFSKATTTNIAAAALATATSSVCGHTRASSVGTPNAAAPFPPTGACTLTADGKTFTGTGYLNAPKFTAGPPGGLPVTSLNAWKPSSAYPTPIGGSAIVSTAAGASVQPTIMQPAANVFPYGASLNVSGQSTVSAIIFL